MYGVVNWSKTTPSYSGALSAVREGGCEVGNGSSESRQDFYFNASSSNTIYTDSYTAVTPLSRACIFCIKF